MMKRFNKILALVLAMSMLCCVVSISVSAADTTNASYKVRFVDNAGNPITSVAAGSCANAIISIKTNGYSPIFAFHAFYDATALTLNRQNREDLKPASAANCAELLGRFANTGVYADASDELLEHEDDMIGAGAVQDWGYTGNVNVAIHTDSMYPDSFTDAQKAQYKAVYLGFMANSTKTVSCLTVNTEGAFVDVARFRFYANADTELNTSTFFLPEDQTKNYIMIDIDDEPLRNCQVSNPVKVSNLTIEYEGGVTPPPAGDPITVENISTQVQWQSKDEGLMRVAFRGNIKNYTLNLVDGSEKEIADIAEMGVVYSKSNTNPTVGGANCTVAPAWTIYNFTTGGYFFRAVVGNYPYDNAETLYANAYIIIDGQTITAQNDTIQTSGAEEYARATTLPVNPMPAK